MKRTIPSVGDLVRLKVDKLFDKVGSIGLVIEVGRDRDYGIGRRPDSSDTLSGWWFDRDDLEIIEHCTDESIELALEILNSDDDEEEDDDE